MFKEIYKTSQQVISMIGLIRPKIVLIQTENIFNILIYFHSITKHSIGKQILRTVLDAIVLPESIVVSCHLVQHLTEGKQMNTPTQLEMETQ